MPDQGPASDEHALLREITAPFETLPPDPVPIAADVDFPVVLRGYDRLEVDEYVRKTTQLVAELQATRSPEAAVRRALERLGEQISGILQRAHESAEQITAQSRGEAAERLERARREAEDRLERARREAAQITAAAEQRLTDLDAETDRIWAERRRIIDDVRELAGQLDALSQAAAERFPPAEEAPAHREPEHATEGVDEAAATIAMAPVQPLEDDATQPLEDDGTQPPEDDATQPAEDEPTLPLQDGDTAR